MGLEKGFLLRCSCILGTTPPTLSATLSLASLPELSHGASKLLLQVLWCVHRRPPKKL